MKKLVISLLVILLFSPFTYPQKSTNNDRTKGVVNGSLRIGNELYLDDFSVKFIKVIFDSRCPQNVKCIWQGEAKLLLGIHFREQYFEKEVVISGRAVEIIKIGDLEVSILHLSPYPQKPNGINPKEYCVGLKLVTNS